MGHLFNFSLRRSEQQERNMRTRQIIENIEKRRMLKTFDKKSKKLKVKMMEGGVIVNNEQGKENIEELIEQTTTVMIKAKSRRDVGNDRTKFCWNFKRTKCRHFREPTRVGPQKACCLYC